MHDATLDRTWMSLRTTYGIVPIVAGADKFTNLLVDWSKYLSPFSRRLIPTKPSTFMKLVGIIEIGAGALALARPRLGGYLVGGWLAAIAAQLVTNRTYYDIAVRDAVMAIGAFGLAQLTLARVQARQHEVPARPREHRFQGQNLRDPEMQYAST